MKQPIFKEMYDRFGEFRKEQKEFENYAEKVLEVTFKGIVSKSVLIASLSDAGGVGTSYQTGTRPQVLHLTPQGFLFDGKLQKYWKGYLLLKYRKHILQSMLSKQSLLIARKKLEMFLDVMSWLPVEGQWENHEVPHPYFTIDSDAAMVRVDIGGVGFDVLVADNWDGDIYFYPRMTDGQHLKKGLVSSNGPLTYDSLTPSMKRQMPSVLKQFSAELSRREKNMSEAKQRLSILFGRELFAEAI